MTTPLPPEPPAAEEAEQALLGCVLWLSLPAACDAITGIGVDDFTVAANRVTFEAVAALVSQGEQPSALAVLSWLRSAGKVTSWPSSSNSVGVFLHTLAESAPLPLAYQPALTAVLEAAARRRLYYASVRLGQASGSSPFDSLVPLVMTEIRSALDALNRLGAVQAVTG
jgi:replicative DNA helicase